MIDIFHVLKPITGFNPVQSKSKKRHLYLTIVSQTLDNSGPDT